ncbi:DUF3703 domain-containing protein [Blastomonas fulva]|jgi:hypothetical protein|uniref:DUF3703 domain-containing protein n=1 Tax=Blastomonas fulva TaxID=1550728 RepID=UPI003D271730
MTQAGRLVLDRAFNRELASFRAAADAGDNEAAWRALERGHVLSQQVLKLHVQSHWAMLGYAVRTVDPVEVIGQLVRIMLAPVGALTRRIPVGNTGRSRVSAFAPMTVPQDLRSIIEEAHQ